jgi:hypothetical protein
MHYFVRWGRRMLTCVPLSVAGIFTLIAALVPRGIYSLLSIRQAVKCEDSASLGRQDDSLLIYSFWAFFRVPPMESPAPHVLTRADKKPNCPLRTPLHETSDSPRLRTGAMLTLKCFATVLYMLYV